MSALLQNYLRFVQLDSLKLFCFRSRLSRVWKNVYFRVYLYILCAQVNIALWPRFKMVFDMHISSLRNANVKMLWEDDVRPHYVMRRYAEFTASLIHLNVEYGDGQVCY